jgi:Fe-S-cluster-containing dehydrogenase component/formate-dependent nitrite reductase membrane component NrfD
MNYAFLIDNRKCIGCHACSTACKAENEVPLGVYRTWVKYVEKGQFPHTRRFFQVTRCNHCANPPCVRICPVTAMYQRDDGIVEFDSGLCIGCKACLQACPYDAIYIDPETHTAAKCHFCAHRIDVGLEPACVIVCPEQAIIAGDLDDPNSLVAQLLTEYQVQVRKPEQGTRPKLFYIEAEESAIVPMAARSDGHMLWAEHPALAHGDSGPDHGSWRGPIQFSEGPMASALLESAAQPREVYNVSHKIPWHWQVPAYLTTKAIGAGAFMVAAAGLALGLLPASPLFTTVAALIALLFIGLTTGLLVWDLDRPERFWTILIRPQWRSWLARGAFVLTGFSAVAGLWFLGHLLGVSLLTHPVVTWLGVLLAVLSAVYTAFLFAQAEGRDLWQSPLVPWHLFVQGVMAGAAILILLAPLFSVPHGALNVLRWTLAGSLLANLAITLGGEFAVPHASAVAAAAAHLITHGPYRRLYWGSNLLGLALPFLLVILGGTQPLALAVAALLALAGLLAYEWAFVMAPQEVPNS